MMRFGDTYQQVDMHQSSGQGSETKGYSETLYRKCSVQSVLKGAIEERSFDEIK